MNLSHCRQSGFKTGSNSSKNSTPSPASSKKPSAPPAPTRTCPAGFALAAVPLAQPNHRVQPRPRTQNPYKIEVAEG
jgi:hypothetical protein